MAFIGPTGIEIPSISTDQMREVDRIAVEEFQLGLLQMMENAGRNLAEVIMSELDYGQNPIVILAGPGGNGGGGLSSARHLHNHGFAVELILARPDVGPAVQNQLNILHNAGLQPLEDEQIKAALQNASVVIDALIGYSLKGAPRGRVAKLIKLANSLASRIVSLDMPSGVDATTGDTPGVAIQPALTVTLALPKLGLEHVEGEIILADIGIPPEVYKPLGLKFDPFWGKDCWIPIDKKNSH